MALGKLLEEVSKFQKEKKKVYTLSLTEKVAERIKELIGGRKFSELIDNLLTIYLKEKEEEILKKK